ncbi:MAG TPA: ADOP family duplicated permease [Acidobacteriaceae bacterium]|nr:ADOP family duplicated permease [Acidobacteriaceae bacterium]
MTIAWRIYRSLAEAFPHEFKMAYGDEMMQAGEDVMRQIAKRHGVAGAARLILDIGLRLPVEYLGEMRQDLRYAARALVKSPGFATVGIVSMGLGIGLTTSIYSTGWQLLNQPLPRAANASRLAMAEAPVPYVYIERYREQRNLFSGVAALETGIPFSVGGNDGTKPERIFGQLVSPDFFDVLGVSAERGRMLDPALDGSSGTTAVVISDRYWRSHFGGEADVAGHALRLNGQNATIVGIAPKGFDGAATLSPVDVFVPVTAPAAMAPELENDVLHAPHLRAFAAIFCLAPGVTLERAETALDGITRRLDQDDPMAPPQQDKAKRVVLMPAGTRVPIPRTILPVLDGFYVVLFALILGIACMNLATMLMARGANRRRELAIRLGIGASRWRLVRQMISEGMLLSLLGGVAGFGMSLGLAALNARVPHPAGAPVPADPGINWGGALFALAAAVVCGIGFSVAPAVQATRVAVAPALKESAAAQLAGYRQFGLRNLAIVGQVTGSLMLLLITGFLAIGVGRSADVGARFNVRRMILASIDPVRDGYTPEKAEALFATLPERLRDSGQVGRFAMAAQPPFSGNDESDANMGLTADGAPKKIALAVRETVGAGYFAVLDEPMAAGREFTEADQREAASVTSDAAAPMILNRTAARSLFGNEDAVGRRVRNGRQEYEVVGVAQDMRTGLGMQLATAWVPLTAHNFAQPGPTGITLLVRTDGRTDAIAGIRRAMAAIDPKLTLFDVGTLGEYLELNRYALKTAMRTYGGIALFALLLSAIGLSGVTAYAVAQRRKEIGIRMALGARKPQVLRLVLREGAALIGAGIILGFLGAIALSRILSAVLTAFAQAFQVGADDPRLLVGVPLLLAGLALMACWIPARRATSIDPLQALREE